jgi:dienelactone hydrolase
MKHPIDLLGGLIVSRGPKRLRFFSEGWGDEDLLAGFELPSGDPEPVAIDWGPVAFHAGKVVTRGEFPSPAMDVLPDRAHRARVIRVEPAGATARTVVLMAAWNEHDPRARLDIASLLADRGIASLILENPYYGERRPNDGDQQPIRTVSDFFQMGAGAVAEGRALLAMVRDQGRRPGIAGYSMGGNVTALVSALVPFAVATTPLAPSYSPAPVYLDGVLRGGIDWSALGGETRACRRLRALLLRASVLEVPAPPHARHAVLVAARRDGYVPPEATEALHHHWPGSELRWTPDGHATLLWFRKPVLATAISDSFARVQAGSPNR